jgi:tRNA threonylcarbamoyladenosine biosynthesis protein TsaE
MPKQVLEIYSESREQTSAIGRTMAGHLKAGDVVALTGELGSGKTVFVQGACAGLGVQDYVTSPTFTLIQEYTGRLTVFHFDFFRLENFREIEDLDLVGYFQAGGICLIEWAERGRAFFPEDYFSVEIFRMFESGRMLQDRRRIKIGHPDDRDLKGLAA